MATCGECIHFADCLIDKRTRYYGKDIACANVEELCKFFKSKSNFVEVVRCKDCKYYKPYNKPVEDFDGECIVRECETDETEFCSYAKLKESNDETK